MPDLKGEVENLLIKNIGISNLDMFARLAENFNCKKLMEVGVKLMITSGVVDLAVGKGMTESMPKFSAALLIALSQERRRLKFAINLWEANDQIQKTNQVITERLGRLEHALAQGS